MVAAIRRAVLCNVARYRKRKEEEGKEKEEKEVADKPIAGAINFDYRARARAAPIDSPCSTRRSRNNRDNCRSAIGRIVVWKGCLSGCKSREMRRNASDTGP
jgi:hypothetical protein